MVLVLIRNMVVAKNAAASCDCSRAIATDTDEVPF
jgi:hypothetical protein